MNDDNKKCIIIEINKILDKISENDVCECKLDIIKNCLEDLYFLSKLDTYVGPDTCRCKMKVIEKRYD